MKYPIIILYSELFIVVGDNDGMFKNKRFFECPNLHGVIVPVEEVNILVPSDVSTSLYVDVNVESGLDDHLYCSLSVYRVVQSLSLKAQQAGSTPCQRSLTLDPLQSISNYTYYFCNYWRKLNLTVVPRTLTHRLAKLIMSHESNSIGGF